MRDQENQIGFVHFRINNFIAFSMLKKLHLRFQKFKNNVYPVILLHYHYISMRIFSRNLSKSFNYHSFCYVFLMQSIWQYFTSSIGKTLMILGLQASLIMWISSFLLLNQI